MDNAREQSSGEDRRKVPPLALLGLILRVAKLEILERERERERPEALE